MTFIQRRPCKTLNLGGVLIGGGHPISIQSMTNTPTEDIAATTRQIKELAEAGCDIVRLAVPHQEAAAALPRLVQASPVPLVADIHFDYRLALAAIEGGIAGLRLNPGNIGDKHRVEQIAARARAAGIPIRVGVNGGSLEKHLLEKYGGPCPQAMAESALGQIRLLEENGFEEIKVSLKASSLPLTVAAYQLIAPQIPYPLHVGLTEAGTPKRGILRSAMGIGMLLAQGLGDTIRVSLTGNPLEEVWAAKEILKALELRQEGFEFISCPTCGRTDIDVEEIALEVEKALEGIQPSRPMKIAIMGCAVNGPGEAREADAGIAGGRQEGLLFVRGKVCGKYPNHQLAQALLHKVEEMLSEEEQKGSTGPKEKI